MYHESKYDQIVYNGRVISKNDHFYTGIDDHPIVYEVIRLVEGVPLFFKEHIDRMQASTDMMGFKCGCNCDVILDEIQMLVEATGEKNQNVKLLYTEFDERIESFVYFIPSFYPDKATYDQGVDTVVYHMERENPNAKVLNRSLKEQIEAIRKDTGAYEAVLVNRFGQVTEGSRSNVFFVRGDQVITARSNAVLEGITRQKIMEMMRDHRIEYMERDILESDIETFDGAFLTGTSINILPIRRMDRRHFDSSHNKLIQSMMEHLDSKINQYIKEHQA